MSDRDAEDYDVRMSMIDTQPILWAGAMLEEAERVRSVDARDAILSRVGVTLLTRFGITYTMDDMARISRRRRS